MMKSAGRPRVAPPVQDKITIRLTVNYKTDPDVWALIQMTDSSHLSAELIQMLRTVLKSARHAASQVETQKKLRRGENPAVQLSNEELLRLVNERGLIPEVVAIKEPEIVLSQPTVTPQKNEQAVENNRLEDDGLDNLPQFLQ
jgi:hypothetical protein